MSIFAFQIKLPIVAWFFCHANGTGNYRPTDLVCWLQQLSSTYTATTETIVSAATFFARRCWNSKHRLCVHGIRWGCRYACTCSFISVNFVRYSNRIIAQCFVYSWIIFHDWCGRHNCKAIKRGCSVRHPNAIDSVRNSHFVLNQAMLVRISNTIFIRLRACNNWAFWVFFYFQFWSIRVYGITVQQCPMANFR